MKEDEALTVSEYKIAEPGSVKMLTALIGQGLRVFDLAQLRVPLGGSTTWSVPGLRGDEPMKHLECIIGFVRGRLKAWWTHSLDEGGSSGPPQCSSTDSLIGIGNNTIEQLPGGIGRHECPTCAWNQFGSKRVGGRGKDCSDFAEIYLFRPASRVPMRLTVPPTSLKALLGYNLALIDEGRPPHSVITRIGLVQEQSGGGIRFARMSFEYVGDAAPEVASQVAEASDVFREAIMTSASAADATGIRG